MIVVSSLSFSSFLPSSPLPPALLLCYRLHVQAVEATGEAEQLVYKPALEAEAQTIAPITGYVVILPQHWVVHGQELWQGAFVSSKYQVHTLWNNDFLVEMLQYFLGMAGAKSIPLLDEFAWRVDKVGSP